MNRELIKLEMSRHYWAITEEAFDGICNFLDSDTEMKSEDFHVENEKPVSYFGEPVQGSYYSYRTGDIGLIMIDGPIIPRATFFSSISGAVSIDVLSDEFKAFEEDPTINEIVLLMDTPGGSVTGTSDFSALVKSSEKPTTAFGWMAASAGYEIASATDTIVAPPTGMFGSIGTMLTSRDDSEAQEKRGIRTYRVISDQSPNKNASLGTEKGQATAQIFINDLADAFIENVASNRGKTSEEVINTFGGGAMFAAGRAKSVGMIDQITDFDSFIKSKTENETQPKNLFGFSTNNEEGKTNMSEENTVQTLDKEAIVKTERERIQGIEALASMSEGKHPEIVSAVHDKINSVKFDADMTKESAEVLVLRAINDAQGKLISKFDADHKTVNKVAEHVSTASGDDAPTAEEAKNKARGNDLIAAALEGNR